MHVMGKWIREQHVEFIEDEDQLEIDVKGKLITEKVKRMNKQNVKHWRNGREQYNDKEN